MTIASATPSQATRVVLKMPTAMPARSFGTTLTASPSISPHGKAMPTPISTSGATRAMAWRCQAEPDKAAGGDQQAGAAYCRRSDPARYLAGEQWQDQQRSRQANHQLPGLDLAHSLDADEADRQQHQQDDEAIGGSGRQELDADEAGKAEQREIEHRPAHAPLDDDESGKEESSHDKQPDDERIGPAALRRLQHAIGQRCQRDREGAGSRPVEAGRIGVT